jgi:NAD-dependent SIR2 family protein deacetylase
MFQLLQIQTFECTVCKQLYNEERIRDTIQAKTLVGAAAYAVCPCCHQQVSAKTMKNRAYRKRADNWVQNLEFEN